MQAMLSNMPCKQARNSITPTGQHCGCLAGCTLMQKHRQQSGALTVSAHILGRKESSAAGPLGGCVLEGGPEWRAADGAD